MLEGKKFLGGKTPRDVRAEGIRAAGAFMEELGRESDDLMGQINGLNDVIAHAKETLGETSPRVTELRQKRDALKQRLEAVAEKMDLAEKAADTLSLQRKAPEA